MYIAGVYTYQITSNISSIRNEMISRTEIKHIARVKSFHLSTSNNIITNMASISMDKHINITSIVKTAVPSDFIIPIFQI